MRRKKITCPELAEHHEQPKLWRGQLQHGTDVLRQHRAADGGSIVSGVGTNPPKDQGIVAPRAVPLLPQLQDLLPPVSCHCTSWSCTEGHTCTADQESDALTGPVAPAKARQMANTSATQLSGTPGTGPNCTVSSTQQQSLQRQRSGGSHSPGYHPSIALQQG